MVLARIPGSEHAIDERAIELDIDEAVHRAVLQHLEASDRPPELLPQLDVIGPSTENGSNRQEPGAARLRSDFAV
jgi:hypothetical protein